MNIKKDYQFEFECWLKHVKDEDNLKELNKMDASQKEDAFYRDLEFGTGGLRGVIGAGTNRINVYTVAKATKGFLIIGLFYVEDKDISIQKNSDPIYKNYDILVKGQMFRDYDFVKLLRNTKDGASGRGLTDEINQALQTAYKRLLYEYDYNSMIKNYIAVNKQLAALLPKENKSNENPIDPLEELMGND